MINESKSKLTIKLKRGGQKGGNAINFIMEAQNLAFKDAVAFLAERYNVKSE